jgi:hypothetical protein
MKQQGLIGILKHLDLKRKHFNCLKLSLRNYRSRLLHFFKKDIKKLLYSNDISNLIIFFTNENNNVLFNLIPAYDTTRTVLPWRVSPHRGRIYSCSSPAGGKEYDRYKIPICKNCNFHETMRNFKFRVFLATINPTYFCDLQNFCES